MKNTSKSAVQKQIQMYGSEDAVIAAAMQILRGRVSKGGAYMSSPSVVREYLTLNLASLEYEVFWAIYLNSQNRIIVAEEAFRGTLTQTSVYPREIVKRALQVNAGGVIFAHNHPSGVAEPSRADESLTSHLKQVLSGVDVRVLDHIIIGAESSMSFAERGIL